MISLAVWMQYTSVADGQTDGHWTRGRNLGALHIVTGCRSKRHSITVLWPSHL